MLYPAEPKYLVGLSQASYALGKLKLAERYATLALKYNPDLIDAELMLALVLNRYGEKKSAEKRRKKKLNILRNKYNTVD